MKVLAKTKLAAFLEGMRAGHRVIAPLGQGAEIQFGDLDTDRLAPGYSGRTRYSAKECVFPESEVLLTFGMPSAGEVSITEHPYDTPTVLWGIRPCDVAGIQVLDAVFLSAPVDAYYQARRDKTLLLSLNCNEVGKTCFCASLDTGPFARSGFDLVFTDLGEEFLVEVGTVAGEALLDEQSDLFEEGTASQQAKARELQDRAEAAFSTSLDVEAVRAGLAVSYDDPIWGEQSAKCTLCGTCCVVCPACHCFNVEDIRKSRKVVDRVRYWDACQFTGFTRMATSNSRPTQAERWRQKIYDKFVYIPARYEGALGCTGCGRCLELCQGSINIVDVMTKVTSGS
jgi:sulfhydrogenase subunit beta (sulfur reductase)